MKNPLLPSVFWTSPVPADRIVLRGYALNHAKRAVASVGDLSAPPSLAAGATLTIVCGVLDESEALSHRFTQIHTDGY